MVTSVYPLKKIISCPFFIRSKLTFPFPLPRGCKRANVQSEQSTQAKQALLYDNHKFDHKIST